MTFPIEFIILIVLLLSTIWIARPIMRNTSSKKRRKIVICSLILFVLLFIIKVVRDIDVIQSGLLPLWRYVVNYSLAILVIIILVYGLFRSYQEEKNAKVKKEK